MSGDGGDEARGVFSEPEIERAQAQIKARLMTYTGEDYHEDLLQYVSLLLKNHKTKEKFAEKLDGILDDHVAKEFVKWLWEDLGPNLRKGFKSEDERDGKNMSGNVLDEIGDDEDDDVKETNKFSGKKRTDKADTIRPSSVIVEPERPKRQRKRRSEKEKWTGADRASAARGGQRERRLLGNALNAANRSTRRQRRLAMEREEEPESRKKAIRIKGGVSVAKEKQRRIGGISILMRDGRKVREERNEDVPREQTSFRVIIDRKDGRNSRALESNDDKSKSSSKAPRKVMRRQNPDDTGNVDAVAAAAAAARGKLVQPRNVQTKKIVRRIIKKRKKLIPQPESLEKVAAAKGEREVEPNISLTEGDDGKDENKISDDVQEDDDGTGEDQLVVRTSLEVQKTPGKEEVPGNGAPNTQMCWYGLGCHNPACYYAHPEGWNSQLLSRSRGRGRRGRSGRGRGRGYYATRGRGRTIRGRGRGSARATGRARGRGRSYDSNIVKELNKDELGKIVCRYDLHCKRIGCYYSHPERDQKSKDFLSGSKVLSKSLPKTPPRVDTNP